MTTSVPEGFRADLLRWQHLVHPVWLEALIAGRTVAAAPAAGWRWGSVRADGGVGGAARKVEVEGPGVPKATRNK